MLDSEELHVGLGAALRHFRAQRQLSQEELGLRTGVHRNYIGGIERGEREPTVVKVAVLARGLDVTLAEIFARVDGSTASTSSPEGST